MMKKPDFVTCSDCEHFYWYAGQCCAYDEPEEFEDLDGHYWWSTMFPETITWCTRFGLKHTQEPGCEHYDPLPSVETIKKMKEVYMKMCDNLITICGEER